MTTLNLGPDAVDASDCNTGTPTIRSFLDSTESWKEAYHMVKEACDSHTGNRRGGLLVWEPVTVQAPRCPELSEQLVCDLVVALEDNDVL